MTDQPVTNPFTAAMNNFAKNMEHLAVTLTVQNAMGGVWSGDLDRARTALHRIPPAKLADVALSALALASLAETIAKDGATE